MSCSTSNEGKKIRNLVFHKTLNGNIGIRLDLFTLSRFENPLYRPFNFVEMLLGVFSIINGI